jgi:hypothetical protein
MPGTRIAAPTRYRATIMNVNSSLLRRSAILKMFLTFDSTSENSLWLSGPEREGSPGYRPGS